MHFPITADVLVPVGVGVLVAILTIVALSLCLRRPVTDALPSLSDWTGEMAMPSLVGRPGASGPVTVAEAMAVRQADTAPLRVISPATALLPQRAPYVRPAAEFEQQPMVPAARRAQDDRMPFVTVSELDGSPDWLVPTVGPADHRLAEPRTTAGAPTTPMPPAPAPMQPAPVQPAPTIAAPAPTTAAGVTASITSALIAAVAARAAAAAGARSAASAAGVQAAVSAPAAPSAPATAPVPAVPAVPSAVPAAPGTPTALPAYLTAPAPAAAIPAGTGVVGTSAAAGVPSAGPAAPIPARATTDAVAVSPTATTAPLAAVEPGRADGGVSSAGDPSPAASSVSPPVAAATAPAPVPANQQAITEVPDRTPPVATTPQAAPTTGDEHRAADVPVQEAAAQDLPVVDTTPAGSTAAPAEDLIDLPDLPHRDPSRVRDAAATAGSGRPVAAAVAQALAVRAAAAGPTGTPRGDARDRLLAVLLADPVRAVGAATDLATCQDQLARFRAAVEDSRLRLGEAVNRLAGSGLTQEQLIRLTGLSDDEIRTLLAGRPA